MCHPEGAVLSLERTGGLRRVQHPEVQVAHHVLQYVVVGRAEQRHHGRVGGQVGHVAFDAASGLGLGVEERTVGVGHFGDGTWQTGTRQTANIHVLLAHLLFLPGEATQHVGQVERIFHQLLPLFLFWPMNIEG